MRKFNNEEIQNRKLSINEVKKKKRNPIFILLDNIRSLQNVGAIFRTCDAALIEKLYLCGISGVPPRKEIDKTALGACEVVPWEHRDDAVEIIEEMKKNGVSVIAVELAEKAIVYSDFEYDFPVCFVLGHEVYGVSDAVMDACNDAVYVPMGGRANSLNVATCAGIVAFEALRQFGKGGGVVS